MAPRPSAELGASLHATKGERTRGRLLELAVQRFGERGYRSTSVSEIARAAGLTQASAYAYFANKESLFLAAIDADATAYVLRAYDAVPDGPAYARFRSLFAELYVGLDDHPLTRRILAGGEPDVVPRLVDLPAIAIVTRFIVDELQEGQRTGDVRDDVDAVVLGAGIEAIMLSLLITAVQSSGLSVPRYQAGINAAFDAMLGPPA